MLPRYASNHRDTPTPTCLESPIESSEAHTSSPSAFGKLQSVIGGRHSAAPGTSMPRSRPITLTPYWIPRYLGRCSSRETWSHTK
jgi:hypothetical protein